MLSKTATYWLAGIGVVGVAAVTPAILKHYHVWPGGADAPAPLLSPTAANAPPPSAAAPAATTAAPATPTQPAPTQQAAAEPPRGETPPARQPAAPESSTQTSTPTAVASSKPAASEQQAAGPSASPPATTPAPVPPAPPPTATPAPTTQPKPDPQRPAFDVVRVEPTGDAVIAGRASPRAAVQLRSDGRVVAQVDADESGQFAILPPPFSAGGHRLQLAARSGGASEVLSDAIGIDVPGAAEAAAPSPTPAPQPSAPPPTPAKPAAAATPKPVETARNEAPAPPKAAPPPEAAKAKPPEPAKVAALDASPSSIQPAVVSIFSVEATGTGRFVAKGAAEPNTVVRLYLNNAYLADAIVGADGRWSLTIERGMTPGAYAIRADEIDRASGAVVARAEAPFNYPDRPTQVAAATPTRALPPTPEQAPTKPAQDQTAPSASTAATPAPRPAASPQATPAPQAAEPVAPNEAPQTSAPTIPATAPEQPKANGTDVQAKTSSAPALSAAGEAAANPPPASTPAAAEPPGVAAAEPAKPADSAHPVIPDIRTTKVVRGDNLWNLSKQFYGDGPEYKIIYEANSSQIRNPRLIYPDQIFVVPRKPE